jgi:Tol biopolymer transport system component
VPLIQKIGRRHRGGAIVVANPQVRAALPLRACLTGGLFAVAALVASSAKAPAAARPAVPFADIYLVRPDGSHLRRLTHGIEEEDLTSNPTWARNGRKLVFASGEEPTYISSINSDGSRRVRLGGGKLHGFRPSWSPNGRRLLFVATQGGIFVARADGFDPRPLRAGSASYDEPSWSPDGRWILFMGQRDATWHLFVMSADGRHVRQLTRSSDADPAWRHDGKRIAFARQIRGRWYLFTMDAAGRHLVRLRTGPGSATQPTWSPDGRRIAYVVQRGDSTTIWVLDLVTQRRQRLTNPAVLAYQPSWQPRGSQIAFVAKQSL